MDATTALNLLAALTCAVLISCHAAPRVSRNENPSVVSNSLPKNTLSKETAYNADSKFVVSM